jgi:cytochrome c-type biogenesis protein
VERGRGFAGVVGGEHSFMIDPLVAHIPLPGEAFTSGVLSFISPCVLSLLPVTFIYVTGVSVERRRTGGGWRLKGSLLLHLVSFWAGFVAILIGSSVGYTAVGRFLLMNQRALTVLGGILVSVMGLFMTGLVPRVSEGDLRLRFRHRLWGYAGSAAVGLTYGMVWSPCVGPALGAIILLAGSPETADQGVPLLFLHGLGFGVPFFLTGLLFDGLLQRVKSPRVLIVVEKTAGALLAGVGLLIATGQFLAFTDKLFQTFDFWVQVLIQGGL